jgi:WD repeat and SOF domain-containing protein 1
LNAVKLDRLFAKPFVGALGGHIDGVYTLARDASSLTRVLSGSADGEIRLWDLPSQCVPVARVIYASDRHNGVLRRITDSYEACALIPCRATLFRSVMINW